MKPYYEDAAVRLYHGDCLVVLESVAPFVEHCITDPPYFRDVYVRASAPKTKVGSGTPERLGASLKKLAAGDIGCADEVVAPLAELIACLVKRWTVIFSDVENCHRWRSALEARSLRYVRTGAWVKPDAMPQMSGDRPAVGFEPCTIAHAPGPMRWNGGGGLAVWTHFVAKGEARPDHECPKPLPLMVELVADFTDEGDTILDPFCGSGQTGVAAKKSGRRAVLIDNREHCCEVAARQLEATEPGRLFDRLPRARHQSLLPDPEPEPEAVDVADAEIPTCEAFDEDY